MLSGTLPFCGVREMPRAPGAGVCKWPQNPAIVTWRHEVKLPGYTWDQIQQVFGEALFPWQDVANITLLWKESGPVNVLAIDYPMDGKFGVLADCQLPCGLPADFQLSLRVDNTEGAWDRDMLVKTVRHEFGHGLGLNHSSNANDIMYPSLQLGVQSLGPGDISEVTSRYGRRTTPIPTPVPTPTPADRPDIYPGPVMIDGVAFDFVRSDRYAALGYVPGEDGPWGNQFFPGHGGRPDVPYALVRRK